MRYKQARECKNMTTAELIRALKELDPDGNMTVLVASDEEGNSFGYLNAQFSFGTGELDEQEILTLYPVDEFCI